VDHPISAGYAAGVSAPKSENITWHGGHLSRAEREKAYGHRGATLWFTGLSGSGKSTVAREVERLLMQRRCHVYTLDGDNVRHGLCSDLGFAPQDRAENIRRIGEVAKLFTDAATLTLAAFVSPYREDRARVRALLAAGDFIEVYVSADVSICEQRDPKGLYKKARAGEIREFTGISAPYEAPEQPEITLQTDREDVAASAARVTAYLEKHGYLPG
jgi:adenylylsulfate kinase